MSTVASYRPGEVSVGGLAGEVARLESQAALTFDAEIGALRAAGLVPEGVLLDLGCGTGAVTRRLRIACPAATVIGADVDASLLAQLEQPALLIEQGVIPLPSASVDDVLVRYVAQHLPPAGRRALWLEAQRVLRPGGCIHVVDVVDDDWGQVRPAFPALVEIYRKIAEHQGACGGDRFVGRTVPSELAATGFGGVCTERLLVSSADRPVDAFAVHLGPQRYVPLLASGVITVLDLARIGSAWQALRTTPAAYVALSVHIVSAIRSSNCPSEGSHV